jgi:S-adenosyl-L-methionine hydrolase (adenosine-forming)
VTGYSCLTLTTDYGLEAGLVGVMHSVAFKIAPSVRVIDADHSVPAQDVRLGALRLERYMTYAPAAVHVAVVDPGVGGERRAIAVRAGDNVFVGPDNGLVVWAAERSARGDPVEAFQLDNQDYWLPERSKTFDGRDIFVPAAAHIAIGTDLQRLGTTVEAESLVRLERPVALVNEQGGAELEVLQVDGFGNVQLGAGPDTLGVIGVEHGTTVTVTAGGVQARAVYADSFDAVPIGSAVLLVDSDGPLALSVNCGRADELLAVNRRQKVTLAPG